MYLLIKVSFVLAAVACACLGASEARADVTTTFTFPSTWMSGPNGVGGFDTASGFLIPSEPIIAASISGTFGTTDNPNRAGLDVSLNDILVAQCLPGEECTNSPIPTSFHYDFTPEEFGQLRKILPGPSGLVLLVVVEAGKGTGAGTFASLGELTVSVTTASPPPGQPDAPILLTEEDSIRAIALDSVTHIRDPFPQNQRLPFSIDPRTRLVLFLTNFELKPGEEASTLSADAWLTSTNGISSVIVEDFRPVPDLAGVTQVIVRIPDTDSGELAVRVYARGKPSNPAVVRMIYPGMSVR